MRFEIHFECGVIPLTAEGDEIQGQGPEIDEGLEEHLEGVMDALIRLEAIDPSVGGSIAKRVVEIDVTVEAEDAEVAQELGSALVRTAIHTAQGTTSSWSTDWCEVKAHREMADA